MDPPAKRIRSVDPALLTTAQVFLARHLRRSGATKSQQPVLRSPAAQLHQFATTLLGTELLEDRARAQSAALKCAGDSDELRMAFVTTLEMLGRLQEAWAIARDAAHPSADLDLAWLGEKLRRGAYFQAVVVATPAKISDTSLAPFFHPCEVPRVDGASLSVENFRARFVLPRHPVVLTGLTCTSAPFTFDHVASMGGQTRFRPRRAHPNAVTWARLENAEVDMTIAQFVDAVRKNESGDLYLFDLSLPLHCPELAAEVQIPQFFAGDFLSRTPPGSMYRDSWPSLFVCGSGVTSDLHVDAFASHFWMLLTTGHKRWTFFRPEATPHLYPRLLSDSLDPVFSVNLAAPDFRAHPWLLHAQPYVCDLRAGDVLFVPAGCAHRVETLAPSIAISGNFVDDTNLSEALREMEIAGWRDPHARRFFEALSAFATEKSKS